jgi:hypothetical protein
MLIGLYNQGLNIYYKRATAFSSHLVIVLMKVREGKKTTRRISRKRHWRTIT